MSESDTDTQHDRYRCSNCKGVWLQNARPVACPHCGGRVVAGYREVVYREVAVPAEEEDEDKEPLPEFEEMIENE